MSKDLTKEYKEAVMNDLPDLWDRIEAAVDVIEEEKSTVTTSAVTADTKETVNAEAKVTDFKQAEAEVKKKKSKRIPAWVFVSIPSAAILMIAIVPLFLWMASGGGSKSAATMADSTAPAAFANSGEAATTTEDAESIDSGSFEKNKVAAGDDNKSYDDYDAETEIAEATAPAEESEPDKYEGDEISLEESQKVYVCINSFDSETKIAEVVVKGFDTVETAPGSADNYTLANPHKDNNLGISQIILNGEEIKVRVADDEDFIAGEEFLAVLTPIEDEDGIVWEIRRY
ncbi:MAG: hypothetical protein K5776_01575 [Lachnospiraceae bacterium]|nr:hypothetical protein [Lachnospiraceae bacterium]